MDPSVTIPYWDWTVDRTVEATLWGPDFLGGNGTGAGGQVSDGQFAGAAGRWSITVKDDPSDPDFLRRQMGVQSDARDLPLPARQSQVLGLTPYDVPALG